MVDFHFRRTPRAWPQPPQTNRMLVTKALPHDVAFLALVPLLFCGVFRSCTCRFAFGAENICYSHWSRRLSLQSTFSSSCAKQTIINGYMFKCRYRKKTYFSIFYISDLFDSPIFVFAVHLLTPFINHPYLVQRVELFRQPVPT